MIENHTAITLPQEVYASLDGVDKIKQCLQDSTGVFFPPQKRELTTYLNS